LLRKRVGFFWFAASFSLEDELVVLVSAGIALRVQLAFRKLRAQN